MLRALQTGISNAPLENRLREFVSFCFASTRKRESSALLHQHSMCSSDAIVVVIQDTHTHTHIQEKTTTNGNDESFSSAGHVHQSGRGDGNVQRALNLIIFSLDIIKRSKCKRADSIGFVDCNGLVADAEREFTDAETDQMMNET